MSQGQGLRFRAGARKGMRGGAGDMTPLIESSICIRILDNLEETHESGHRYTLSVGTDGRGSQICRNRTQKGKRSNNFGLSLSDTLRGARMKGESRYEIS